MDEPTLEQSIEYLMQQVPLPVRDFILNRLSDTALDLMATHALHVDQAGVLKSELLLMLLGQIQPAEFSKNLQESGVSAEVTRAIVTDVNEMVFKKLREEERAGTAAVPVTPPPPASQVPVMGIEIKEAAPPPYIAPTPAYQAPAPMPAPVPNMPIYSNPPAARTMESDMELAAQGFRPGSVNQLTPAPSFAPPAPAAYVPAPAPTFTAPPPAPASMPQPQSVYTAPVAPPPPTAPPASSYPPPVMASVRLTPVDRTHSNAPITKEYGSDPYREPIE